MARLVAVICCLARCRAGPAVSVGRDDGGAATAAKKKCKRGQVRKRERSAVKGTRRPSRRSRRSLRLAYVDGQNRVAIDITAKTVEYHFYQPCQTTGGLLYGQDEVDGAKSSLPGTRRSALPWI